MNKITKFQLCTMLLIPDAFMLLCMHGELSLVRIAAILAGIAVQAAMTVPAAIFFKRGGQLQGWAAVPILVYVIFCGGLIVSRFVEAAGALYIPYESTGGAWERLATAVLAALVCLYMADSGIKALSRASVIAGAVGAVYLIILTVSAVTGADYSNLARTGESGSVLRELVGSFSLSCGLGTLLVLTGLADEKPSKGIIGYFVARAVISALIMLTALLVVGKISSITDMPVITAAQLSQPFSSQRIDSLLLIIFAIFGVFSAAIQSAASAYLLGLIFPRAKRCIGAAATALIIAAAALFSHCGASPVLVALASAVSILLLPSVMLIFSRKEKKPHSN